MAAEGGGHRAIRDAVRGLGAGHQLPCVHPLLFLQGQAQQGLLIELKHSSEVNPLRAIPPLLTGLFSVLKITVTLTK